MFVFLLCTIGSPRPIRTARTTLQLLCEFASAHIELLFLGRIDTVAWLVELNNMQLQWCYLKSLQLFICGISDFLPLLYVAFFATISFYFSSISIRVPPYAPIIQAGHFNGWTGVGLAPAYFPSILYSAHCLGSPASFIDWALLTMCIDFQGLFQKVLFESQQHLLLYLARCQSPTLWLDFRPFR